MPHHPKAKSINPLFSYFAALHSFVDDNNSWQRGINVNVAGCDARCADNGEHAR